MTTIEFANFIGIFAAAILLANHALLAGGIKKNTSLKLAAAGSLLAGSAALIGSTWFLLGLNAGWFLISLYGLASEKKSPDRTPVGLLERTILAVSAIPVSLIIASFAFPGSGITHQLVGWAVTIVYFISYWGFSAGFVSRLFYLASSTLATIAMVFALYQSAQYSLAIKDVISAVIGILGVANLHLKKHRILPASA